MSELEKANDMVQELAQALRNILDPKYGDTNGIKAEKEARALLNKVGP